MPSFRRQKLLGHVARSAVELEPLEQTLRPGRVAPDELALGVVEDALVDRCAGELVEIGGGPDVVGMEVRDEDAGNRAAGLVQLRSPELLRLRKAHTGVHDRPAVLAREEVRVHVPGPHRQRQRNLADPTRKLCHAAANAIGVPANVSPLGPARTVLALRSTRAWLLTSLCVVSSGLGFSSAFGAPISSRRNTTTLPSEVRRCS
jgi:hypothetical protein